MEKNKKLGVRYFVLSFLITFSVITVVGFVVLFSVLDPKPAQSITENLPKMEHIYNDSDSITVLCISYSRKEPQTAYYSILRLDAPAGRVFVTSLPADTVISELEGRRTLIEIASYSGSAALVEELSKSLSIEIDRYLRIEENSLSALIDEMGAVTYDCEKDVEYYDQNGFLAYSMSKGKHVFFGEKLCGLIKYSGDNEIERANEQSKILCSLFSQRIASGRYRDLQSAFELLVNSCESNINAFDLENRRTALEQMIEDKLILFTDIPFSAEDKAPSEEYLKSIAVYR